jgi:hypothetical protein
MARDDVWFDDLTGIRREFVRVDDETCAIKASADCSAILDANKQDANHAPNWNKARDFHHVASIPMIVCEKWMNDYGIDILNPDHKEAVRRLLNSHEWHYLRTGGGRL